MYWAMTTMSTIGYGDIVPVTTTERLLAIFAMIMGSMVFTFGITQLIGQLADHNSGSGPGVSVPTVVHRGEEKLRVWNAWECPERALKTSI